MQNLNPAWKHYNDLHNEGAEGYNLHAKYLGQQSAAEPLDCTSAPMGSYPGRPISRAELKYLLGEEQRQLQDADGRAKGGDFSAAVALDGIKARIEHYESQLR